MEVLSRKCIEMYLGKYNIELQYSKELETKK